MVFWFNKQSMQNPRVATVSQLSDFDEIVDVRSPAEYAEDHIPGAISAPVLDDAQRAEVGTLYTRISPVAAKKRGAMLIARNVAQHLETLFSDKPKQWKPLVCVGAADSAAEHWRTSWRR